MVGVEESGIIVAPAALKHHKNIHDEAVIGPRVSLFLVAPTVGEVCDI